MTDDAAPLAGQGGLDAPGENMQTVMVGGCVLGYRRGVDKPASRGKVGLGTLRLAAVQRLVEGRHGGPCDTDDGELYLDAAAPLIVASARRRGVVPDLAAWAKRWTPKLHDDHDEAWFDHRLDDIDPDDRHVITADDFARSLGITAAEVKAFKLKTVGAVDRSKRQRTLDRKVADRAYQKAKRAKAGATPREMATTRTMPWEAFGYSESTWRRKGRPTPVETPRDRNSSASITPHMVPTKTGHGSLKMETTSSKPWMIEGVSRAKWYRDRAAAAVSVVMPDPAHANDDDDDVAQAPRIVLEVGRVRLDAVQLAAWSEEFPGLDVLELVKADVRTLDDGAADAQRWQDQAWAYLSWAHHEMTVASNNNNEMSTSKAV